jgi:sulfur relay (sulfurtransferase) complex TusBCD TusD component (DsrE family)
MKSHGLEGSSTCPIAWMDDLHEMTKEADRVLTF